jgi:Cu-Zn family superoxide dismutase
MEEDMRRVAAFLLLAPALAAGCTHSSGGTARATSTAATSTEATPNRATSTPTTSGQVITASGTFAPPTTGATAVTYDPMLVPVGATAMVTITRGPASTQVRLTVAGLRPNRGYGAHLHTDPCGSSGAAAGPHYQHQHDPAASASKPSVDPSYANPRNEVWLDFTTDRSGRAAATATQPWTFTSGPRSLIIHATTTKTAPGEAGTAGARVACLTLPA